MFNTCIKYKLNKYNYNPYIFNFNNKNGINILKNIHILQDKPISIIEIEYIIYNYSINDNMFQYKTIKNLCNIKNLSVFNKINNNYNIRDKQNQQLLNIILKNYIIFKRLQCYQDDLLLHHKFNLDNNLLITKIIDITRENIINNILKYEQKK